MKKWLADNEPYLRLVEVGFVAIAGTVIAASQYSIAERSEKVSEKALKVAEAELELVEKQTELLRLDHEPVFTFFHTGPNPNYGPSHFRATNKVGGEVRSIDGTAKLYLEVTGQDKRTKRLLVDNFYYSHNRFPTLGEVEFYNTPRLVFPTFLGFTFEDYGEKLFSRHALNPLKYPMPFTVCNFVEVRYVGEDGSNVVQRYCMKFPHEFITPVTEAPQFDDVVDLSTFQNDGSYDLEKIKVAITDALEQLKRMPPF
jgi:hypothetical protein